MEYTFIDHSGNHGIYTEMHYRDRTYSDQYSTFAKWAHEVSKYTDNRNAAMWASFTPGQDYPDFIWSVGPRGGLRQEKC